ncbi:MAG: SRPBCC domain-containing protein [Gemmatimonadota bacterium]
MTHDGDIRRTNEGYEAVFTRELVHPPERVWAMLTEPGRIATWYVRCEIEPRLGGKIVEHHEHAGEDAIARGTITRFEPPRVFEHTWWDEEYAQAGLTNVLRWELHPTRTGTRLVLSHRFPELDGAWGSLAGWHILLRVLADVLDGADPTTHALPRGELRDEGFVEVTPGRGAWAERAALEKHYEEAVRGFSVSHAASAPGGITGTFGMTVHVHDLTKAGRFWEALGLRVDGADGEVIRFVVPGSGPLTLHKWESACASNGGRPPGTVSGLMFGVDDASAACARVEQGGGRIVAPPFPSPGGGTWAVVADPDGNEFMLCAPS